MHIGREIDGAGGVGGTATGGGEIEPGRRLAECPEQSIGCGIHPVPEDGQQGIDGGTDDCGVGGEQSSCETTGPGPTMDTEEVEVHLMGAFLEVGIAGQREVGAHTEGIAAGAVVWRDGIRAGDWCADSEDDLGAIGRCGKVIGHRMFQVLPLNTKSIEP